MGHPQVQRIWRFTRAELLLLAIALLAAGLSPTADARQDRTTFAVIGDYADGGVDEAAVANLVTNTFNPDFIVTVGDNNYLPLSVASYDTAIGQFFSAYIGNYIGQYGQGSPSNRFWPALGNHDWGDPMAYQPYLDFFTLPGNERYYDLVRGPIHFFFINSDSHEPDGRIRTSTQAQWLQNALANSRSPWKFVILHHPPFSSSDHHGSNPILQWPFKRWGAHAVFAGHDHDYERLHIGGIPYFVNGIGGRSLYTFGPPLPQTQVRYNGDFGAMCVSADATHAVFEAYSIANGITLIDSYTLTPSMIVPDLVPPAAVWKHLDDGSNQGTAWRLPGFNDARWNSGGAQLGYGDGDETTIVSYGPDPFRKFITTYFRRGFEAAGIDQMQSLTLSILRDDGAVVYINGDEVYRTNLPKGEIAYRTRATVGIGGDNENIFHEISLDPCVLVNGDNLIAVEVHQSSIASSDVSFDLMLTPVLGSVCRADITDDDEVNVNDLLAVINAWGPCAPALPDCPADIAPLCGDQTINVTDLLTVINAWGPCKGI